MSEEELGEKQKLWKKYHLNHNMTMSKYVSQAFISVYYYIETSEIGVLTDAGRLMIPVMKGLWNRTDTFR
jgi:hypothetical protein